MKNIDKVKNKLKNMSVKELAEFIAEEKCECCLFEATCEYEKGSCAEGIERWLNEDVKLTADEMFNELGYETKGQELYTILYVKNTEESKVEIRLHQNTHDEWEYEKHCNTNIYACPYTPLLITKAEHEAICKKLEELKESKR